PALFGSRRDPDYTTAPRPTPATHPSLDNGPARRYRRSYRDSPMGMWLNWLEHRPVTSVVAPSSHPTQVSASIQLESALRLPLLPCGRELRQRKEPAMPHHPEPFYRSARKGWFVQVGRRQVPLGLDPEPRRDKKTG